MLLITQTVQQGLNVYFCQLRPPWSLHEQLLKDVIPELEGIETEQSGLSEVPHAQLSPKAYCSLNTYHSYKSMASFCVLTLRNAINTTLP